MIRRWRGHYETRWRCNSNQQVPRTYLSFVHVTLGGEETIMACAHLCEGIGEEIGFWKVISVAEDVRERERVDCE
jgi:hypothetical protein